MKKVAIVFIFGIMLFIMSGCGFHLRQYPVNLKAKYPLIVLPYSGSHTFHQAMRRAFIASSIDVVEQIPLNMNGEIPILTIQSQHLTEFPLVYSSNSELRRERLTMIITFSFGQREPKQFTLSTARDRQLNSNQHLGDNAEKIIIEREMQDDIINQLLRYLVNL